MLLLGPSNSDTLALVAYTRPTKFPTIEKVLENIRKAKSLNPLYPMWYSLAHGYCAYHAQEYAESIAALQQLSTGAPDVHLYLALSYAELGNKDDAAHHIKKLLLLNPDITIEMLVGGDGMQVEEIVSHFYSSANKAGIPRKAALNWLGYSG